MITATLEEHIVMLAEEMSENGETSKDFYFPVYNGLIQKRINRYIKTIEPVPLQRKSPGRTLKDIFNPFFLQKDSFGRYVLYNHDAANRGNLIVVSTTDFIDSFGETVKAWHPYQMNGNTLIVLITEILNGEVPLQKNVSYKISDLVPEEDEELKYELCVISSNDDLNRIYDGIDNTSSSKSKADNYTSCLGGFGLMNVTTGESDLIKWAQSEMDGPISLIDNRVVPKKVHDMAKAIKPYLPVIKNLGKNTEKIISNSGKWKRVFCALCLDITAYKLTRVYDMFKVDSFMEKVNQSIIEMEKEGDIEKYWHKKLFPADRRENGGSRIEWKGKKSFSEWIRHPQADLFQLELKPYDWLTWELFSLKAEVGSRIREMDIYVKGGGETAGDDRLQHQYKELNFLRLVFIYAMTEGEENRLKVSQLIEWADNTDLFTFPRDCYVTKGSDLIKLGSVRGRGNIPTLRSVLKQFFYSNT